MSVPLSLDDPLLANYLRSGHVGVMPTDTIYGLAAAADNPEAVTRMARLKQGDGVYKPGTVIAASAGQLIALGVDETTVRRVEHLWPNPLSIELPLGERLQYLYQEGPHRAFRVVGDPRLKALLEKTGLLITTSANIHGQPAANTINEAVSYFGEQADFYVDGGDLSGHVPSTVARYVGGKLDVVRQGAFRLDEHRDLA